MTDPNQTNPIQNSPTPLDSPPVASPVFPQSDLPPLPPAFQSVVSGSPIPPPVKPPEEIAVPINKPIETSGSSAPVSELPPVISSGPKKKFGGGRVIATILGLFLLVGGVGAGIVLTQQPQLLGSLAAKVGKSPNDYGSPSKRIAAGGGNGGSGSVTGVGSYNSGATTSTSTTYAGTQIATSIVAGGFGWDYTTGAPANATDWNNTNANIAGTYVQGGERYLVQSPGTADAASLYLDVNKGNSVATNAIANLAPSVVASIPPAGELAAESAAGKTWAPPGVGGVLTWHWTTCTHAGSGVNGIGCDVNTNTTGGGGGGGTTTTTTDTAQCLGVTAYSTTWVALTAADLPTQKPDTTINFCVTGGSTSGSFDKAQFKIGATLEPETTTIRPGSTNEFCQSYKILSTDTTVNVQAKIHHATLGWEGEAI